jgi:hypothetical protein
MGKYVVRNKETYLDIHEECKLFLSDINQIGIFSTDTNKRSNIKFRENPSRGTRADISKHYMTDLVGDLNMFRYI